MLRIADMKKELNNPTAYGRFDQIVLRVVMVLISLVIVWCKAPPVPARSSRASAVQPKINPTRAFTVTFAVSRGDWVVESKVGWARRACGRCAPESSR